MYFVSKFFLEGVKDNYFFWEIMRSSRDWNLFFDLKFKIKKDDINKEREKL